MLRVAEHAPGKAGEHERAQRTRAPPTSAASRSGLASPRCASSAATQAKPAVKARDVERQADRREHADDHRRVAVVGRSRRRSSAAARRARASPRRSRRAARAAARGRERDEQQGRREPARARGRGRARGSPTGCGNARNVSRRPRGERSQRHGISATACQSARSSRLHPARLAARLVVVAEQVQHAVDQQAQRARRRACRARARLARGDVDADHHVAEQRAAVRGVRALEQREREHVGRARACRGARRSAPRSRRRRRARARARRAACSSAAQHARARGARAARDRSAAPRAAGPPTRTLISRPSRLAAVGCARGLEQLRGARGRRRG